MITSARIAALNQLEDGTQRPDPYRWITALRAPPSEADGRRRPAADVPVDQQDLARSPPMTTPASGWSPAATPSWPPTGPASAEDLLTATEKLLAPIIARVQAGKLPAPGRSASRWAR
jgi:hypothetical protein